MVEAISVIFAALLHMSGDFQRFLFYLCFVSVQVPCGSTNCDFCGLANLATKHSSEQSDWMLVHC